MSNSDFLAMLFSYACNFFVSEPNLLIFVQLWNMVRYVAHVDFHICPTYGCLATAVQRPKLMSENEQQSEIRCGCTWTLVHISYQHFLMVGHFNVTQLIRTSKALYMWNMNKLQHLVIILLNFLRFFVRKWATSYTSTYVQ